MMLKLRDIPIRKKLIILTSACSSLALLLSCAAFVGYNVKTIRSGKVKEIQSLAQMLAFNSTAVLTFKDAPAAEELLASLQLNPEIELACLIDERGKSLAVYRKRENVPFPWSWARDEGYEFANGYLDLYEHVWDDGNRVGTLFLRTNMDDLRRELRDYATIVVVVLVCALATAIGLSAILQRAISRPILDLAETARNIGTDGDYSARVTPPSKDEIGFLYQSFNQLLDQIQRSRQALKGAVANMSHEIRTPINAIIGFTELLLKRGSQETEKDRDEYLKTIADSGKHLLGLINDILDFSKMEAGQLDFQTSRCSPQQIIAEVVSVMRVRATEKQLALEYQWDSDIPGSIETDEARFRQLLINVIGNAIKFTPKGTVNINARLEAYRPKPQLVVDVVDSGIGIPPDKMDKIFAPFVQADSSVTRRFGGTGLGLAISRQIATNLGGDLQVSSEVGKGSTFSISVATGSLVDVPMLPRGNADITPSRHLQHRPIPKKLPACRILVVEDGGANRMLIRLVLEHSGVTVKTAENGQIGVDMALSESFDLILMDMQMPVMDGYTASTKLREHGMTLPIIALTAHAMRGDEKKCLDAGCSGYLTKPVDCDKLLLVVAEALEKRGLAPATVDTPQEPLRPTATSYLPLDDEDFQEIVREFILGAYEQRKLLEEAWQRGDLHEVGRVAHWFKGGGGTAGFDVFTDLGRKLERLANAGDRDGAGRYVDELLEMILRLEVPPQAKLAASSC